MLVARWFKINSSGYLFLQKIFNLLNPIMVWYPQRWFWGWIMVLAGANVVFEAGDRYFFWKMSTFSWGLFALMFIGGLWNSILARFPMFPSVVNSIKSGMFYFFVGFILFSMGTVLIDFSSESLYKSIPYMFLTMGIWVVYSIPIMENDSGKRYVSSKTDQLLPLVIGFIFTLISSILGIIMDDPIVSTAAMVYVLFPLVALLFPAHVRHIQRARIYGIFIPAMFLSARFPWFLIPLIILFWGLRFYHYFCHGFVSPTFKVDIDDNRE